MEVGKVVRSRVSLVASRGSALGVLAVLVLLACSDDSPSEPEPPNPPLYGSRITPRVSYEADPLLAGAYQSLTGDGYDVAHDAISWAEIAVGSVQRDWESLDRHIQRARVDGLELSIVVDFFHGGEIEPPEYVEFIGWSWEEPTLLWELSRFLREVGQRSQGTLRYLWLGEGPDRYIERNPDLEEEVLAFYVALADTAKRIFPETTLGILAVSSEIETDRQAAVVRAIRDELGALALSAYPLQEAESPPAPAEAILQIEDAIAPWTDAPLALVETGHPSTFDALDLGDEQSAFASLFADWIATRPNNLELVCWSPIHDASATLAATLAERRYPSQEADRDRYAEILQGHALRRIDGARKPAREIFVGERP